MNHYMVEFIVNWHGIISDDLACVRFKCVAKRVSPPCAGQEQDTMAGGFHQDQSFSGEFTELNIWRGVLDGEAVMQVGHDTLRHSSMAQTHVIQTARRPPQSLVNPSVWTDHCVEFFSTIHTILE